MKGLENAKDLSAHHPSRRKLVWRPHPRRPTQESGENGDQEKNPLQSPNPRALELGNANRES